jgi:hypothetical protein
VSEFVREILATQRADWIEFVTQFNDLFRSDHCGYWLRGVEHGPQGWLAWEDDEQHPFGQEPEREAALTAWRQGSPLPHGWFRLDKELADKAWAIGVQKYGERWYDEGDSTTYDVVIQLALLGEVRYG